MVKTLREYIVEAEKNGEAIGHFNVSNIEGLKGVFEAAKESNKPVIVGVSEGERDFFGVDVISRLVKSLREENDFPIFLNADHTYSVVRVKEAIDAGFDMVIYDGAGKTLEENINNTKECVLYARNINPRILVEAELGYIGEGSNIKNSLPEGIELKTDPLLAKKFIEETGVDLLAPAVGNIHGMVKSGNPRLDLEIIKLIREKAGVPLVLHGGSGVTDEDFVNAIKAGVSIIHISTELRIADKEALEKSLDENPDELAPYKILAPVVKKIKEVTLSRIKLFSNLK